MACNDAKGKGSLQLESVSPTPQTNIEQKAKGPKKIRHWRSRSELLAAYTSKSFPGRVHPSFRQVTICLALYLGIGTISFYCLRHQMKGKKTNGIIDTVYFCVVTMATVGYGGLVPNSNLTKLLTCLYVFLGMALVGLVLSKGADYLVKQQENFLLKTLQNVGTTEIKKEVETNRLKYKCLLVFTFILVLISAVTTVLATLEKLNFLDAFYCVCVTMTTLGYGDESFKSKEGRVFAVFWIFISTISLAQLFVCFAELQTEQGQRELAKQVLSRKLTNAYLEAADLDDDGTIQSSEFILFKLKQMGKISQDDISLVMKEFDKLDFE